MHEHCGENMDYWPRLVCRAVTIASYSDTPCTVVGYRVYCNVIMSGVRS